jgi:hypothetical protein
MKSKHIFIFICCALLAGSCKKDAPADKIIGEWQEERVINPQLDEMIAKQSLFIDTVGSYTDSAANVALYGTNNIDTMKAELSANLDSFRKEQQHVVDETWFDFRKSGLVYMHSTDGLDSSNWYFDEDGALILDEQKLKGAGGKIKFDVLALNDTILKINYTEKYLNSTAIFRRATKN